MNTYLIILGNIIGLVGSIFMVLASNSKKQNKVVKLQIFQLLFLGISNIVLGAFTGFISAMISIVRNVICVKGKMNDGIKAIIIALFIGLTIIFNQNGFIGWLPTIASISLTIGLDLKNQKAFRFAILLSCVTFSIFDFTIKNYITFAFDVVTIILAANRFIKALRYNPKKVVEMKCWAARELYKKEFSM